VEVPTTVNVPPRMVAKERGISSLAVEIFRCRQSSSTSGRKTERMAVLLTMPDRGPAIAPTASTCRRTVCPDQRRSSSFACCSAPVREMPALSTNMAMTVRVAELLNPAMPSSGVTCLDSINTTITNAAVMSAGSHSITNKKKRPGGDG
jgi:hypothetical protein